MLICYAWRVHHRQIQSNPEYRYLLISSFLLLVSSFLPSLPHLLSFFFVSISLSLHPLRISRFHSLLLVFLIVSFALGLHPLLGRLLISVVRRGMCFFLSSIPSHPSLTPILSSLPSFRSFSFHNHIISIMPKSFHIQIHSHY